MKALMQIWKHSLPMFLVLLATGCATVREEPFETDMTFDELQQKMTRAMDPEGHYAKADTVVQQQIVSTEHWLDDPDEQLVEVKFERPGNFRLTTYQDNRPATAMIVNGHSGWLVDYNRRVVRELSGRQLEQVQVLSSIASPDSSLTKIFKSIDVEGVRIDGTEYYKLICHSRYSDQKPIEIYVGKNDFLTRRIKTEFQAGGNRVTYDSSILSYSLRDGVMTPQETVVRQDGVTQKTRIVSYKLNTPISASEFEPPILR